MSTSDKAFAGQYSDSQGTDPDFIQRVEKAFEALQTANISALIEVETSSRTIRVLVDPKFRDTARNILGDILPSIPRRLKMRVDANTLRRVTPTTPVLLPKDEFIIGHSSLTSSSHERVIVIADDTKIEGRHLQVRWDGLSSLEVKDLSKQQDARIDNVFIGPDWREVEPGAKIRIGETVVSFLLSDPIN